MALLDMHHAPHGGEIRLLPENTTAARVKPTALLFHSIVGSAEGAYGMFLRSSNLESTFIVKKSGHIIQVMDTTRQADANYQANAFAGSVETEDNGDPNTDPWTHAQLDALVWIAHEYHRIHGVRLQRLPRGGRDGYGYHSMEGAPSRLTPAKGKTCPGTIRIRQFDQVLLPRIALGPAGQLPDQEDEFDMRTDEQLVKLVARGVTAAGTVPGKRSFQATMQAILDAQTRQATELAALTAAFQRAGTGVLDPGEIAQAAYEGAKRLHDELAAAAADDGETQPQPQGDVPPDIDLVRPGGDPQ